ncbi:conserved hypothetical protein [Leishmania infantum JPCM5]|uniref:Uncharacterized protein n=3 Tax=Leishmania donovani species complex TaxID=38574 RepID=A4ICU6_LEIIN|nr:conserved hypothetical protein [Leishmania infantum JPCM5]XP_003865160.1 hypothetical protein, conserved [Leishmania donovani]CAC9548783.1 hypothetical_protein_-_conserved [Leishmania infantum]AYU83387.1 hypothetical protein LdCL_360009300 [Leishmania donovani]TPP48160.1 hypothetical protein CGC21_12550 [Leishmania donovani]CAM72674.1 conserved hypothetical protein [Leishmania infantum JPCM5]CBZ38482.1 hypothetical protein, conserved [Leishmania donovani]|eukprot:XP_001469565.1 conserved hypothetical protein [Leishmania infantum JPCM5]
MYSDGERKTVSELQREAEATRKEIIEEAQRLERIKKATAKTQFSIDQLFRFFAREVETEKEKKMLIDLLVSNPPDLHIECVPVLPVVIAIANGRMTNARRIYTTDNAFLDDSAFILLVHTLRFLPQACKIDFLDISGTGVTERGMCFVLEMMIERNTPFTLVAKRLSIPSAEAEAVRARYTSLMSALRDKKCCRFIQE